MCIGRGLAAIRPKDNQSYKFLFICIHNNKDLFIGRQGMAFESISTQDLKNVKIPLPPLEKQNKIISIIDFIESKITKLDSINKSLESKSAQIIATHLLRI
ncbi:restriction endonuclease subunit S [Helicobacter jaachi]|uniref:Restriction endonuclease subunit S n=1 Tax=Helicobacter jaachi TaxID=1677920 RepID=A0A4U8TGF4_9HELI|nr:restriction endonuclease subunit S [Helicobacter jaachi]